jgi:hypothetical protein
MGNMHVQRCVRRRNRFTPMNFVLPPLLWLGVGGRSLPWRVLNWAIVVGYSLIAVAGARRDMRCDVPPRAHALSASPPEFTCLLFHCGPPCSPARAGAAGRVRACRASGCCLRQSPGRALATAHAPCLLHGGQPALGQGLVLSRACWLRARPARDRVRAAQAPSGPSRPSMRTWPTTTSLPTCSEA